MYRVICWWRRWRDQRRTQRNLRWHLKHPGTYDLAVDWTEMFPDGRFIFYEGDDPDGFVIEMRQRFGFDPSDDDSWLEWIADNDDYMYGFHCPARILNDVYGGNYPMGS
jgi:hypothetical protein